MTDNIDYADILLSGSSSAPDGKPKVPDLKDFTPEQKAAYDRMMYGKRKPAAPAQQPSPAPVPVQPRPSYSVPAPKNAEPSPQIDYADDLLGSSSTPQADSQKPEGWGEWIANMPGRIADAYRGKQDPREADTKTIYEQFPEELHHVTNMAAIAGTEDPGMGNIIAKALGDKVVRRYADANGYEIIVTQGPDGQEQRGYVNKPGLDNQDVARSVNQSLPFMLVGGGTGALMKGAGIGANAVGQFVANSGTSLVSDAVSNLQGSEQSIDPQKALVVGGLGAAASVVGAAAGALWRKFVTIPGLIDKQTGQLTQKGIAAAREAGIDPSEVTPDFATSFAKTFAETGDAATAATKAGADKYGIPATQGQITKRVPLLTKEEGMRRGLAGEPAERTMTEFDKRQVKAVEDAALGRSEIDKAADEAAGVQRRSVGEMVNPGRQATDRERMASTLGGSVQDTYRGAREAARKAEGEAWKGADTLEVTDDALKLLPAKLNEKLGGMMPDEKVTPASAAMAKKIDEIIGGKAPEKAAEWIANDPSKKVDQMRRVLGGYVDAAETKADKTMAGRIYDGFNEWIGDAAKQKLLAGDPETAMKLVKARAFSRLVRQTFEPKAGDGKLSEAGKRLAKIMDPEKADSGEAVIQALFGSQGSKGVNTGAVSALRNLKSAFDRFAPEAGKQAWDDVRLAYWSRLVTDKGGRLVGPQAIVSNIKTAMQGQDSVMRVLYTPAELREIKTFLTAVERIAYKPPNASGSGYTAALFAKEGIMKFLNSFGLRVPAEGMLNYTGVGSAWNKAAASKAVRQSLTPQRPNIAPATAPLSAQLPRLERQESGSR